MQIGFVPLSFRLDPDPDPSGGWVCSRRFDVEPDEAWRRAFFDFPKAKFVFVIEGTTVTWAVRDHDYVLPADRELDARMATANGRPRAVTRTPRRKRSR